MLSWRPADQARYGIWRTSKAGRARVGVTVATRFVDRTARPGRRYAYAVRGVNAEGAGPFASLGVGYRHR